MIVLDANLLLYAYDATSQQHRKARAWLEDVLSRGEAVGLPWQTVGAFLRVVTNPRLFDRPEPIADAWDQMMDWLSCDTAWIPEPTERHIGVLGKLIALPGVHANLVPDAHLAALAIEHGLTLCSTDGDFARFPGLRWLNPLAL